MEYSESIVCIFLKPGAHVETLSHGREFPEAFAWCIVQLHGLLGLNYQSYREHTAWKTTY